MPTCGKGGTTNRNSLSSCQPHGAAMRVEENAEELAELLFVRLVTKIREIIRRLLGHHKLGHGHGCACAPVPLPSALGLQLQLELGFRTPQWLFPLLLQ